MGRAVAPDSVPGPLATLRVMTALASAPATMGLPKGSKAASRGGGDGGSPDTQVAAGGFRKTRVAAAAGATL